MSRIMKNTTTAVLGAVLGASLLAGAAHAGVAGYRNGDVGVADAPSFDLKASAGYITVADGAALYMWGFSIDSAPYMQYPGPTLIVDQGDVVTINLSNCLGDTAAAPNVSFIVSGFDVTAATASGVAGAVTQEAEPASGDCSTAAPVSYTFTADRPGTYLYQSATDIDIQMEMGLFGSLIVRPTGFAHRAETDTPNTVPGAGFEDPFLSFTPAAGQYAYRPGTEYDHEYLFVISDIDDRIHSLVQAGDIVGARALDPHPVYWFLNGRAAPDTFFGDGVPWLPTQPYGAMARMQSGNKVLVRMVSAGRQLHPYHLHGNHARVIAVDGYLQASDPSAATGEADLGFMDNTILGVPGQTVDAVFEWSDRGMGWDIFNAETTHPVEWHHPDSRPYDAGTGFGGGVLESHGHPMPVTLPNLNDLTFGGFWSGSPYLGNFGELPPGEGGLNLNGGYFMIWHSHTEKELTNNDIFPGGFMTMMIIEPYLDDAGDKLIIPRGDSFETNLAAGG